MNAKELSRALARSVGTVAEYLLPGGKKKGGEWCCGSVHGDAGDSLKVRLVGEKAGVWCDFATGEAGDLLDLWMAARSCGLHDAMTQASEYLGVAHDAPLKSDKTYTRPDKKLFRKPTDAVVAWLKGRGLTDEALKAYKVASKDNTYAVFPYFKGEVLVNYKARHIENKKDMRVQSGGEQCLFGWQAIHPDARSVTICEGEVDALTLWQYGRPALSVFGGAGNFNWIDCDFDRLEQFSEIFISMDMDEAGQGAVATIVERLGADRCRVVKLPHKDANECQAKGVTREQMDACFAAAEVMIPSTLKRPIDFLDQVMAEFYPNEEREAGVFLPWPKTFKSWRLRDSELTVWTGINGHGKSLLLGYVMVAAMEQGEKVCIASLEMPPKKTLMRMVRQMTGMRTPSQDLIKAVLERLSDRLWVFNVIGASTTDSVLETFRYARKRFGVTQFVVDSLTKIVRHDDDFAAQKDAVEKLVDFKNVAGGHIHLVAHSRKGESEDKAPRKMDIKGTSSITDLADNVCSVWRNKAKDDGRAGPGDPDAVLYLDKQRNGEFEGSFSLFFDKDSMQYLDDGLTKVKPHKVAESMIVEESF